ncbi:major facilitator super transporter protein [Mortierella sp. GBA30]|nr:major facilitator super transporter protein [Mortierella sp. GBA30]
MFAKGFFPYKAISTSFSTLMDLPPLPAVPLENAYEKSELWKQEQEQRPVEREGQEHIEKQEQGHKGLKQRPAVKPRFGKMVLMLVDALRSDFLYGDDSDFAFMQSLIENNKAIPFTALASAPTVTLPRLKALTTGTVPGFLDAILNIAESDQSSTLANQDNWIAQLARSTSQRRNAKVSDDGVVFEKRKIGFFGDDTWIKLFPELFYRSEGTSSFFAMDTIEVDNNVTRHVEPELARDDWDGLIFHYLGLDHVGHSGGPKSALMKPKQAEMDAIAGKIYKTLLAKDSTSSDKSDSDQDTELPTLFILCGDHGMNEVGNHGGSSRSEISTSFLFLSSRFESDQAQKEIKAMVDPFRKNNDLGRGEDYEYYKTVNQVDLVPTISLLMGLPIPKNNVGKLIPELLLGYTDTEKLRALQINAYQVAGVLRNMWSDFETEGAVVLRDYKDPDLDLQMTEDEEQSTVEKLSQICSVAKSEKQRLACWYTLALAEHASFLEMSRSWENSVDIVYQERDRNLKFQAAEKAYLKFLADSSSMLSTALSKYDMPLLTNGSLMMAFAVTGLIYCAMQTTLLEDLKASCQHPGSQRSISSSQPSASSGTMRSMTSLISAAFSMKASRHRHQLKRRKAHKNRNDINWIVARVLSSLIVVLYLVTLFASSFVEEEHQFWYFFSMTWWFVLGLTSWRYLAVHSCVDKTQEKQIKQGQRSEFSTTAFGAAAYCFFQMAILRLLRSWNQTGQKYADQIDLRYYLNSSWTGCSWILFWASVAVVVVSMVTFVFSVYSPFSRQMGLTSGHPEHPQPEHQPQHHCEKEKWSNISDTPTHVMNRPMPTWKSGLISVLQALLAVLIVMVALWIVVYKMDLESAFFGEEFMNQIHAFMSSLSSVGYSAMDSAANGDGKMTSMEQDATRTMIMSGYEMARGCYAGLGGIIVLTLGLKALSNPAASDQTNSDAKAVSMAENILKTRPKTLFQPLMLLGTATLLLILLSRRHNAPIFVLFGIQLWVYLQWIVSIRQRPVLVIRQAELEHQDQIFECLETVDDTEKYAAQSDAQVSSTMALTRATTTPIIRTIPGLSSLHSSTILLCTLSSFFILGNSNSIASIDISNAYVGIQAYDIFLTGVLTFVSNWAGPIWWAIAAVAILAWDLEWELAWVRQEQEILLKEEERRAWETVHGWKRAEKGTLTRKTRRRIQMYKSVLKNSSVEDEDSGRREDRTVEAPEMEGKPVVEVGKEYTRKYLTDNCMDDDAQERQQDEEYVDRSMEQDGFIVDEDPHEGSQAEEESAWSSSEEPCILGDSRGYRRHLVQTRVLGHLVVTSLFFGISLYALSIAAIVLRHHLFIWTVFSPKVLYQLAWTVLFQTVVQVLGVGAGVWSIVTVL